jgi:hypothetical protein
MWQEHYVAKQFHYKNVLHLQVFRPCWRVRNEKLENMPEGFVVSAMSVRKGDKTH